MILRRAGGGQPRTGKPGSRHPATQAAPPNTFWPLLILFLINVLNFYDRQALGAITEPLRREFGLSDTQVGALATTFTLVYALGGVPLGRLADTWSRKRLLAIGTTIWAGLTAMGGAAVNYPMLVFSRLGVGLGEAVCGPVATSWVGDLVPPERRARAMARLMMAVPLGGMLSFAVTGPVAQAYGWRMALVVAAIPAVALVPALMRLKEPERTQISASQPKFSASFGAVLRDPAFRWIIVSGAVVNFVLYSFSTFVPAFLTRFHQLSVASAGIWTGVGSGVSGVTGAWAAGVFGDRVRGHRGHARMRLAAGAALAAAPLAYLAISMPAGAALPAILLIMAAYGLLQTYYGLVYAAIQDIVPPRLRGTAMGAYFMAMYLCGASFGPLVTGGVSDYLAHAAAGAGPVTEAARATGLRDAMYLIPALSAALAVVLWLGGRAMRGESQPE